MSKRDYYEVLNVTRTASEDEIRKAYKKAAVQFHPDRNPGDASAEASFKEATEAYSVLSDAGKRERYDRFGHSGVQGSDFDMGNMGNMGDMFSQMFSDLFGGGRSARRAPARGQDIRVETELSFAEAFTGCKKEVKVRSAVACDTCGGNGAAPGSKPETCRHCGGNGQVSTQRGFIMFSTTCPSCQGQGRVVTDPCKECSGRGATVKERSVLVTFPAGVDSGVRLRVSGQGMPGPSGAPSGDLYVDVGVHEDERYQREGADLIVQETIAFSEAALGTKLDIHMPDETVIEVDVPHGTQPGTVLTLRGKGFPRLDRPRARGDLLVFVNVRVPKKLSRKAKKLLAELDSEIAAS